MVTKKFANYEDRSEAPKLLKARIRHSRIFVLLVLPILLLANGYILDAGFVHEAMEWLGYALVILCVFGRAYCSLYIGGRKNAILADQGPYSVVRNPLYVFSFIGVIGIGLESGMVSLLALLVVAFLFYYKAVVAREEDFLTYTFGEPFLDYMRRVPRWRPDFSLWSEPEFVETKPIAVRRTLIDAAMFFLPYPIFEIVEQLHHIGFLPHYLTML